MSDVDNQIRESIKKHTEKDLSRLQDEIWTNLEDELFSEILTKIGGAKNMDKRRRNRLIPIITMVAAALAIMFTLQTDPGMAFVKGIKDIFVPEKEIIQNIEGQDEPTDVSLNEGEDSEYVIYIDETLYKMITGDNADTRTATRKVSRGYDGN